jgi:3-deoxy-D-manno-octulosonate 8-phosphate phosphatase (KDO 8-P phosphatase)
MSDSIQSLAKSIKLFIFDVDGVLTDGKLYFSNSGEESKAFNSKDGLGIKMLLATEIEVGIITGRKSMIVSRRARELGIKHLYQGHATKLKAFADLLATLRLKNSQVAYMGDDINDIPIMQQVGLSIAPNNALDYVQQHASYVTSRDGGDGAARQACDLILNAQNKWQQAIALYGN